MIRPAPGAPDPASPRAATPPPARAASGPDAAPAGSGSAPAPDPRTAGRRLVALAVALALTAALADTGRDWLSAWIDATVLPPLTVATGTEVLARDGSLLRAFPVGNGLWRLAPPATGVDPRFAAMLIAWEDRRFATHGGVDPRAVLRAGWQALRHGRVVSGASTLTMQTARLLERGPTGDAAGKLRQVRVALALERRLDKARILDLYFRLAPYGGNTEGVRAASLMWFGKEPGRLTPAESALLVALPQSPEARRPDLPTGRARARTARDRVIARAEAQGILTAEAAETARATPLPTVRRPFPAHAPLLADRLRREHPGAVRIDTTLDPVLQRAAEDLAARAVADQPARLSAALILADHRSGEVLAHVGAAQFTDGPSGGYLDMTHALRSPGSTLKPLVYALGFDDGLVHPETLIEDRPAVFGRWQPENFDRRFRGTVTIRQALAESLNIPVVRVAERLGPARIVAGLRRAGVSVRVAGDVPGLALVLGGGGASLHDLVQGYAALARGGQAVGLHVRPQPAPAPDRGDRVVGPVAAWQVGAILGTLQPPGGRAAGRVAWKTGTSYGHRDALAIGYDGRFVAGVWMGRPDGTPVPGAFGGDLAAPVLFDLFDALGPRARPLPPPPPAALTVPNAALPPALRRFVPAGSARPPDPAAPVPEPLSIIFPPDGAEVELAGDRLAVRVRGGRAPYTWLLDGRPVAVGQADAVADLPAGPGHGRLSVTDAAGRSARVGIRLLRPGG
ncbi:penicillin-binding protein 1C [Paracoccus endophyticus]|uniref:penicillin-binding protein 1C n=1 Tax=Paracoccus endophyticus TaxID=2233774 RepID=UPI000DDAA137|nr:penicillin-binding protein 1C [Paracoccus endophyticus]